MGGIYFRPMPLNEEPGLEKLNREAWLTELVDRCRPLFVEAGTPLPDRIQVSVGWPSRLVRRSAGECWAAQWSLGGIPSIFISPMVAHEKDVVETLIHELGHAALGWGVSHRKPFKDLMTKLGQEGPATGTYMSEKFREETLPALLEGLPNYPHVPIVWDRVDQD